MIDDFKRSDSSSRPRVKLDSLPKRPKADDDLSDIFAPEQSETATAETDKKDDAGAATDEPVFRTPEEIATSNHGYFLPPLESDHILPEHTDSSKSSRFKALLAWRPTKKQAVIGSLVAVTLLAGGAAFFMSHHKPKVVEQKVVAAVPKTPAPTPKPILSPLSGLPVSADQAKLPITGVMIENSADARPQSGLDQAGVVFEAIAEAGITRFLALYQENNPAVLGPVRSARPYFVEWADTFDAGYAHVGGSPDGLQRIRDLGVKDMDQFFNAGAYHRISTRYAPHNMYTSMDALRSLENSKGYTSSTFTPFIRKLKEEPSKAPTARSIDFDISGSYYDVHYDYDAAGNSYKRSEGGDPHIDHETKQQLSPKVVIALAMPYSLMADGYHSIYNSIGSGQMLLFQDGTVTPGTWSKADVKSQFVFKDAAGKDMQLNPGQTWITVLSDISKASYHP